MALFGLLPDNSKYVDDEGTTVDVVESNDGFFLSPDESKSYGDIDYMRKSVQVKKTFPKGKGPAVVTEISADKIKTVTENKISAPAPAPAPAPVPAQVQVAAPAPAPVQVAAPAPAPTPAPVVNTESSSIDNSIDFLAMARNISGSTRASSDRNLADSYLDRFRDMAKTIGNN